MSKKSYESIPLDKNPFAHVEESCSQPVQKQMIHKYSEPKYRYQDHFQKSHDCDERVTVLEEHEQYFMNQYNKDQKMIRGMKCYAFLCIGLLMLCILGFGIMGWFFLIDRINMNITIGISTNDSLIPSSNVSSNDTINSSNIIGSLYMHNENLNNETTMINTIIHTKNILV